MSVAAVDAARWLDDAGLLKDSALRPGKPLRDMLRTGMIDGQRQEMNVEVGGTYKMSFQNFSTGNGHSFSGKYVEIKPNEFLKYTDKFDDPNLPGEMTTTVSFRKTIAGTELKIVQEGIPAAIPAEMCYLGWQDSLDKLIRLTDPEIPDA